MIDRILGNSIPYVKLPYSFGCLSDHKVKVKFELFDRENRFIRCLIRKQIHAVLNMILLYDTETRDVIF